MNFFHIFNNQKIQFEQLIQVEIEKVFFYQKF